MNRLTVAVETLGCKVNQYESSYFLESLREAGCEITSFQGKADVYIVHSCAVTSKAGFQTRQLLRRARRLNPEARIVVAGCDAQLDTDRIQDSQLATHLIGTVEKLDLVEHLREPGSPEHPYLAISDPQTWTKLKALPVHRMHSGRARAFLKVQDGCNTFCSYCAVPYVRGKSRSLPPIEVHNQMGRFLAHGYREVVLTGIHLGQWGRDLDPALELADLLATLPPSLPPARIRLSSIEPVEWTEALRNRLPAAPWICPHFHVPLQSGDPEILKRMHRPYGPREYGEIIQELHALFPDAALGADVMVGFPGESERNFLNTYELIDRLPLTYLHVFPYSPRPGTLAARWPGRATGDELKRRARAIQALGTAKSHAFRQKFPGRRLSVLVEREAGDGWWQGTSENYLQVLFPSPRPHPTGSIAVVRIEHGTETGLVGRAELTVH